jgi:hypothetical protein
MMSSFASVFVANANATPENVVPYRSIVSVTSAAISTTRAYKINANDQLRFVATRSLYLGRASAVMAHRLWSGWPCTMHRSTVATRVLRRLGADGGMT